MTVEEKKLIVYELFLKNSNLTIKELSNETGFSRSSVQRYLEDYAKDVIPDTGITIQEQLQINKIEGQRKGGINFFRNNDPIRGSSGHFGGSVESDANYDKEEKKRVDIYVICSYFIDNYPITLDQMVLELEDVGAYSRSYIHDCLHDDRIVEVLGITKSRKLIDLLSTVRKDVFASKRGVK